MIVGLLGFIGSGKNAAGEILAEKGFVPLSFAASLKDATSAIFGWDRPLLEGDTNESRIFRETVDPFWTKKFGYDITPRIILQQFGTEVCRNHLLSSIWVDSLERKILQHKNVVITDMRFENEIEFVHNLGGSIIQIDREETRPDWFSYIHNTGSLQKLGVHVSEYGWYGNGLIDHVISNDGNFEDLESRLDNLIA